MGEPLLRVVRGNPTTDELAAVVAALLAWPAANADAGAGAGAGAAPPGRTPSAWVRSTRPAATVTLRYP